MQDLSPREIEALSKAMGNIYLSKTGTLEEEGLKKSREIESLSESSALLRSLPERQQDPLSPDQTEESIEHLKNIKIDIEVVLGHAKISLAQLAKLHVGNVLALNEPAGALVDIEANGKLLAHGEVVVVDENYGVKILEIVGKEE